MSVNHNYWAGLIRVWRESAQDPWRAMLEDPHTGERLAFGSAEQLVAYLQQQFLETERREPQPRGAPRT